MNSYPRESVEFQPVTVTVDGTVTTSAVQVCVTAYDQRPTAWTDPTVLDSQIGVMVEGRTPGVYKVWAKITDNPEIPVIDCGDFAVT